MTDDLSQTSSEDIENGRFFVEIEIDLLTIPHIPPLLIYNEFECRLTGVSSLENVPFSSVFKRKSCHEIQTIVNMSDDCDNMYIKSFYKHHTK